MRIRKQPATHGSILVVTLLTMAILGAALVSYLTLVSAENHSVARSLAWNNAIPVAESGIEEALTQIYYTGTNTPGNNWAQGTDGLYHKTRSVGADGSYYAVAIQMTNRPVLLSTGYVRLPLASNSYVSRTVQVIAQKAASQRGGVVARGKISFSGGAFLDSFDSADPTYSTNGLYTATKRKDNGQAVSNAKTSDAIYLSGGAIYGYATTGPGGTVGFSGSAKVGDIAWITSSSTSGLESGHVANDANVDFPAVDVPSTSGLTPGSGTYNGTNYVYLLDTGNYYQSGKMTIPGGKAMAVTGDAVLYVDNDFTTSGSGYVYLYPGASLKLYVSGAFTVSGGGIVNGSQDARKLSLYGVNTAIETWTYSGSAAFIGTVYSPNSNFTFSGGAGASGAFTANTITISGSAGVHFDENLVAGRRGYVVASWNEL